MLVPAVEPAHAATSEHPIGGALETVKFGSWVAQVDPEANRTAYSHIAQGAAEECSCPECRNFIAARGKGLVYPADVVGLFGRMGVDADRESEVYGMDAGANRDGLCVYGGWFNVVGRLLGDDVAVPREVSPRIQLYPSSGAALPDPAFGDVEMFRIEFVIALPWVLDEPNPNLPAKRGR
jgi:hypothetical protein